MQSYLMTSIYKNTPHRKNNYEISLQSLFKLKITQNYSCYKSVFKLIKQ